MTPPAEDGPKKTASPAPEGEEDLYSALEGVEEDPAATDVPDEALEVDDDDDILAEAAQMLGGEQNRPNHAQKTGNKQKKASAAKKRSSRQRKKRTAPGGVGGDITDDPLLAEMEQLLAGPQARGGAKGDEKAPRIGVSFRAYPVQAFLLAMALDLTWLMGFQLPEVLQMESGSPNVLMTVLVIVMVIWAFGAVVAFLFHPGVSFLMTVLGGFWLLGYELLVRFVFYIPAPFSLLGSLLFTGIGAVALSYCGYHAALAASGG